MRLILALAVLVSTPVFAEVRAIGVSAFGANSKHFQGMPCHRWMQMQKVSVRPATAVLPFSFDGAKKPRACLRKFWSKYPGHITELHFSNEPGRRNNKLDPKAWEFYPKLGVQPLNKKLHKASPETIAGIQVRVAAFLTFISGYENSGQWILSTGLEDNYDAKAWKVIYDAIKQVWPYEIARTSVVPHSAFSGVLDERHGYSAQPKSSACILNGDGQDLGFLQGSKFLAGPNPAASMQNTKGFLQRGAQGGCVVLLWAGKWQGFYPPFYARTTDRRFTFHSSDIPLIRKLIKQGQSYG